MTRSGLIDVRPLRTRAFRDSWLGTGLIGFGFQVGALAVLQQTWELTGSPLWTGAIGLATAVPTIVFGLYGGALADRVDRRRLVRVAASLQLLAALALVAQAALGNRSVLVLLGLVAVLTVGAALGAPARRTFAARLLPVAQVPAGVALTTVSFQLSLLTGPAAGGLLLAGGGFPAAYVLEAVTVAAALLATLRLPAMPPEPGPEPGPRRGPAPGDRAGRAAAGGWGFLFRRPTLRGSFVTDLSVCLLAFPVSLFPLVNELRFGGDPRVTGYFLSAVAVGGLAAGVLSGTVTRIRRSGAVQLAAAATWGLALAGFGLAGSLGAALACLVLAGAADSVSVIVRGALVQTETPDAYRGRVSSAELVVGIAGPELGNFRGGLVAALTSAPVALVTGGVAAAAAVAWVGLTHRPLRAYRTPPEHPEGSP